MIEFNRSMWICGSWPAWLAALGSVGSVERHDIRQKAKRGLIQPYLKTQNRERDVDRCSKLSELVRECIGKRTSGLLFCTSTGAQLLQSQNLKNTRFVAQLSNSPWTGS